MYLSRLAKTDPTGRFLLVILLLLFFLSCSLAASAVDDAQEDDATDDERFRVLEGIRPPDERGGRTGASGEGAPEMDRTKC